MCLKWFNFPHRRRTIKKKNTSVSKAARLKVNTPALCTSQIRQFGRRRKHFAFTWRGALTSTWEGGNLFVCCDCICARLNLRQNKYMCHIVSRGWGRQSWIEDKKRIRSVTSCVNPGFSRLKLCCTALGLRRAFVSIYPSKSTQMSSFSSSSQQQFLTGFFLPFQSSTCISPHFSHKSFFSPSISKRLTILKPSSCTEVNTERIFSRVLWFDYISVTLNAYPILQLGLSK